MMRLHIHKLFYIIVLGSTILACGGVKKVAFETPVDTRSKPITVQTKQTFAIDDLGVYASNDFDGARLNGFRKVNDSTVELIIKPENQPINNSAYYAFKTWSDSTRSFYFTFNYPKGFKHRYVPKLKISGKWQVIDTTKVVKKDSIVSIKLNLSKKPITIAAQEIQTSNDVRNWYTALLKGKEDFASLKSVGTSTMGRNIPVIDIYRGDATAKDLIVLLTRQHPPEVTGYYAFQSFLTTILNGSELSNKFLDKYHLLAFPIINPDGVDMGHWRHNYGGVDTNRDWSRYNQPEIKHVVQMITKTIKKNRSRLILGLDFHSTWHDVFYTNKIRKETTLPDFIDNWFSALETNIPGYKVNEASGNSTKPVSKGWFLYGHDAVGITYEIGDKTPKKDIEIFGAVSADEMMKILVNK